MYKIMNKMSNYDVLKKKTLSLVVKRIFDIVVSAIMLIILSPVFLVLAIAIKIDSRGPVFYRQERITQFGKKFRIFKFRTMVANADKIVIGVCGGDGIGPIISAESDRLLQFILKDEIASYREKMMSGEKTNQKVSEGEISVVMSVLSDYFRTTAERVKFHLKKEDVLRKAY